MLYYYLIISLLTSTLELITKIICILLFLVIFYPFSYFVLSATYGYIYLKGYFSSNLVLIILQTINCLILDIFFCFNFRKTYFLYSIRFGTVCFSKKLLERLTTFTDTPQQIDRLILVRSCLSRTFKDLLKVIL